MPDYGQPLQFGIFVSPRADQAAQTVELAALADGLGLDLVTVQDHPYQPAFLDTWTLLAWIAARTSRVRVAPNVANLPLRPPQMLARAVASLDVLSGGRAELGLGAGAFWDGVVAMGGRRLSPGASVDALAEAVSVIRATWDTTARSVRFAGEHYPVSGARPGPAPVHRVSIWLGAYKPRMLRLTGAVADGWLPSEAYLSLEDLPAMHARVDAAAVEAGREPAAVRRMLNLVADGLPPERLAELTLETGISTFIADVSDAAALQRFAEDVVPAVRELVAAGRAGGRPASGQAPIAVGSGLAAIATPGPGVRLSEEQPWDESERPTAATADPGRTYTREEQAVGQHLVDVHDHLRSELTQLRHLARQVAAGKTQPAAVRSFITRMTIRQNNWTLGTFCETYCRVVTHHHTLEDRSVFPHLRSSEPGLEPVLDRLEAEHHTIADLLERVDAALVDLVAGEGIEGVEAAINLLTDALLSHFSYEERELIEPLARLGFS